MLKKNPKQRISSEEALNHPAFTIILSQSPLAVRNVFDNKELIKYTSLTEEYDHKKTDKRSGKRIYNGVPDRIDDMSPTHYSNPNPRSKNEKPKFNFPNFNKSPSRNPKPTNDRVSPHKILKFSPIKTLRVSPNKTGDKPVGNKVTKNLFG